MSKDINQIIETAVQERLARYANAMADELSCAIEMCESPIEEMMLVRLACLDESLVGNNLAQIHCGFPESFYDRARVLITPQQKFGKYRVDFFITFQNARGDLGGIVVECDGHDYHDKTKQQAARDKARDRTITALGFPVFRYTGSEIYANAENLLGDLEDTILAAMVGRKAALA